MRRVLHKKFSKEERIEILGRIVIVMGVLQALATIPQALDIWTTEDSSGVSFISWAYYLIFAIVLFMYGIVQKQRPLVVTYGFGAIMYAIVVAGIVVYT